MEEVVKRPKRRKDKVRLKGQRSRRKNKGKKKNSSKRRRVSLSPQFFLGDEKDDGEQNEVPFLVPLMVMPGTKVI